VKLLTPAVVNSADPAYLHRFSWVPDAEIGNLDKGWNYLEGWYAPYYDKLKAVHYTLGGPWFENKQECDFAEEWLTEYAHMNVKNIEELELPRQLVY
jgi:hypothetical protein